MTSAPASCRLCSGSSLRCLGSIPDSDFFAGRILNRSLPGGKLWLCKSCGSMFRHPVMAPGAYTELYASGAAEAWSADATRNDLGAIRAQIAEGGDDQAVLDIGCGGGGFLLTLPTCVRKFGIEPSTQASIAARQAGVRIVGSSLEELSPEQRFDAITIIDVIEHVIDPLALLDRAVAHLVPGGRLFVATADPDFWLWRRVFRSRFWYSGFPEHITFPSIQAFDMWRKRHQLVPLVARRIRYRELSLWRTCMYICQMTVFVLSPSLLNSAGRLIERLRNMPPPVRRYFSPGAPGVFADHQVIAFMRPLPPAVTASND